jgi:hypothetical protein
MSFTDNSGPGGTSITFTDTGANIDPAVGQVFASPEFAFNTATSPSVAPPLPGFTIGQPVTSSFNVNDPLGIGSALGGASSILPWLLFGGLALLLLTKRDPE